MLPAVADPATAQKAGRAANPRSRARRTRSISGISAIAKAADAAFKSAKHVTRLDIVNNRLVPNAMEPRAAIGEYDAGTEQLHAVEHDAEPARRAARHRRLRRHGARAQAARDRARRRRRLRLEDFHLSGRGRGAVGVEARRAAGEMDLAIARRRSSPTRTAAITSPTPRWRSMPTARSSASRAKTIANLGAYMSTFSSSVPTYLYATLLSGQYEIPQIYCEVDAVYTNTVPVDAYRGAGRPEATFVVERLIEVGARELGIDPAELRRKNFIKTFPHQTPVIMTYDAGDYDASLKKAMEIADYKGFGKRKREVGAPRQAARHRLFDLHRSLRHRAVAGGRLARRRRRPVGIRGSARQSNRFGRSPHRISRPRPGPRDDVRAARVGAARHADREHLDRAWRHRQGAVRHGHLRLALRRRSACRRS